MPASEASITNLGLTLLGARTITSLDDDTTEARVALVHYEAARDALLEAREWTFAVKRQTLPKLSEPPDWGYGAAFLLPADLIRLLEVRSDTSGAVHSVRNANSLDWRREENTVLTDAEVIRIRYLSRITDPTRFSSTFVQALGARMAVEMCLGITQSPKMLENVSVMYAAKMTEAATMDGMQGRSERIRSSRLTGVRGTTVGTNDFASGIV